jgi:RNA polymerase-interacting CarD/CdnL/TRCF family regulator
MYSIGDNIVYGSSGVMTVVDIRDELIGDISRSYYVLKSPAGRKDSLTFVPVDNDKLTSTMRPLVSEEQILRIIDSIPEIDEAEWINDNRTRAESFKQTVECGTHAEIIAMIKAIFKTGMRRIEEGKKNYLADEAALKKAEHVLYSEFSAVLGIDEEAVPEFISSRTEWVGSRTEVGL